MRKTNIARITLSLIFLSMTSSCSALPLAPQLQNRRLWLNPDKPGWVYYEWEVCEKKFIFEAWCTKKGWKRDDFDLNDPVVWKTLIDMGFTLTSERRWQ